MQLLESTPAVPCAPQGKPLPAAITSARPLPVELGGDGLTHEAWSADLATLGYQNADLAVPLITSLRASVALALCAEDRSDFNERYVRPMAAGALRGSFAYTERHDVFALQTRLTPAEGGGYRLDGEKIWVTGAETADVFVVYAMREGGDLRAVVVDRDLPGVSVEPIVGSGLPGAGFGRVIFDDVAIAEERILTSQDGISHAQQFLNGRRLLLLAGLTGRMRAVMEACIEYGGDTVRYGQRLADMPSYQSGIGRLNALLHTSKQLLVAGARAMDAGNCHTHWDTDVTSAKWMVTELAQEFALQAMKLCGGAGFEHNHPASRFHRDVAGLVAGAGAQDVIQIDLGVMAITTYERQRTES